MEKFSVFVNNVDSLVWSMVLVGLCLGVGLYLSIRLKFPQIRLMKEMIHLLMDKEESESGITPFQAFATTVGARVGMGNIAGVASAIFYGGPGSVFWMWMIAAIGAASAFVESALGQAYKVKNPDGEFVLSKCHSAKEYRFHDAPGDSHCGGWRCDRWRNDQTCNSR